jgi:hypothetical protein
MPSCCVFSLSSFFFFFAVILPIKRPNPTPIAIPAPMFFRATPIEMPAPIPIASHGPK